MQRPAATFVRTTTAGVTMKNACHGSGFDVRVSRPFLQPGDETECSWCHRTVTVTRSLRLRAHSLATAPLSDRDRRPGARPVPRSAAEPATP